MQKPLSIPDLLLEFHDADGRCLQLWNTEITFSQTEYKALTKRQCGANLSKDIQVIMLPSISEKEHYHSPSVSSVVSQSIDKKTRNAVVNYCKWLHKCNNPVFGKVTGFKHTWILLTVMIKVWLHYNDGQFNILDDNLTYFTSAQLSPDMDKIRDCMLQHFDAVSEEEDNELDESNEEENEIKEEDEDEDQEEDKSNIIQEFNDRALTYDSVDSFKATHVWTLPELPIDWDSIFFHLQNAIRQTGYTYYAT
ncbi:uncharacterized protein F5891DRAFT_982074 [Suillus fuscotomentosus]|uniref:Uncharacterized protein n=1 Tax=Suillus fuscotomentosus TaxID=1912939 RepID=A0AAD4E278_9AGAM|nr:uncharacterized protein F5891DRAFT_982074 [Suillus fuscotomentosus]KAG1898175.1 hypothetical protein F5891DRAFT_982074 [Suillus fuscotomentosus]